MSITSSKISQDDWARHYSEMIKLTQKEINELVSEGWDTNSQLIWFRRSLISYLLSKIAALEKETT